MRKLFFAIMAIAAIALVGCKDKKDEPEINIDCSLPADAEAVDLGLPSGIKWANMNVGATTPEGYGAYFAWGETNPKSTYDWSTYFDTKDDGNTFIKYYNEGGKTVLEPADDAARVNWGADWRMPTKAEQDELRSNCTWTWTTQNGVNGYLITSNKNSNSIFLPASGCRYNSSLANIGSNGYYWSSSLYSDNSDGAYYLLFLPDFVYWFNFNRYYGESVRPVYNKQ